MSDFIKAFEECLNSNFSCNDIILKLQNLSKYSINQKIGEFELINKFMKFSAKHFLSELSSVEINRKQDNFIAQSKDLFNISHMIITNKEKYKNNSNYEKIELFYHTFFFSEFSDENETNDFTFFYKLSDDYTNAKKVEIYLFNIGLIILSEEIDFKSKLIEALFSKDTPDFLTNIILICFEYIRYKKQDISYFIKFCIPYLNHFNLYFLSQILYKDCNYKSNDIRSLFYLHFEKNINNLIKYNILDEESKVNYSNIKSEKNEIINTINTSKEEIEKYFNISNLQEMKDLYFEMKDKIKENNEKFINMFKLKDEMKYKIVYDKLEINDETINVFSFIYLLKYNQIQKIDEHFFQIYNKGNIRIEIFSNLLSKYMIKINQFLEGKLKNEEKKILFQNSGFYKFKNEYIFLMYIDEEDLKLFYLKNGLSKVHITSLNKDNNFMTFQIYQSEKSTIDEYNYFYQDNDIDDEVLYNFGNYSFENDLRCYIKHFINNKKIFELPRLYFLLNYCIPLPNNEYKFITNIRSKIKENSSYGYCELDFVLKNESNEDIIIEFYNRPYQTKLMMYFPKEIKEDNNQKIILKKNSIIFFEFKSSFPQFNWKDKFNLFFKKVKKFLEIYKRRGVYEKEYIQLFFVYNSMPEIYYLKYMKSYINKHFSFMFDNFEFGIFYFSKEITILSNQIIEKKLSDMQESIKEMQKELKELKKKK